MHVLDQPIWAALNDNHRHLAIGDDLARRYPADISPFVAVAEDTAECLERLAELVAVDETVVMVRKTPIVTPPGFTLATMAGVVQMVATRRPAPSTNPRPELLGADDETRIYELAMLTRPGPFARHTMRLGEFWGVKRQGRLIAMAGERLRQGGWAELSGVCVHPDHRGQGLARLLSAHVSARMAERGEQPYLHCIETNTAAMTLYQALGYEIRETMNVVMATRVGT